MGAVGAVFRGVRVGFGLLAGAGAEGRCRAGRVLPGPCGGAAPAPRPAGPSVRSSRAGCGGAASSDGSGASVKELFPARAGVLRRDDGRCRFGGSSSRPVRWCCTSERVAPHGSTSSFPRDSGVLPRMLVLSGRVPMCRAGPSAHGRISTALNAGALPHDSADPPPTGPGRMCSTAPALPMPRTRARPPRPDTADPHSPAAHPPSRTIAPLPAQPVPPDAPVPRRAPRTRKCSSNWCSRVRSAHLGEEDEGGGRRPRRDPSGEKGSMRYAPDGSRTPEPILGPSLPIRGWRC